MRGAAIIALTILSGACAHQQGAASIIPAGRWGGEQVGLDIDPSGSGVVTLPCAGASFAGPLKLDAGGHFLTTGTFTQGSGAPPVEPPTPVPASISGRLDGDGTLWLDIATRDGPVVKSAQLRLGREPVIYHCP